MDFEALTRTTDAQLIASYYNDVKKNKAIINPVLKNSRWFTGSNRLPVPNFFKDYNSESSVISGIEAHEAPRYNWCLTELVSHFYIKKRPLSFIIGVPHCIRPLWDKQIAEKDSMIFHLSSLPPGFRFAAFVYAKLNSEKDDNLTMDILATVYNPDEPISTLRNIKV